MDVYGAEAETVLLRHPCVVDVAVIGVPSSEFGEEAKALIVPTANCTVSDQLKGELLSYCQSYLASHSVLYQ